MKSSSSFFAIVRFMYGCVCGRRRVVEDVGDRADDLLVEDHPAGRGEDQLTLAAVLDRVLELHLARLERLLDLLLEGEPLRPRVELRHVERRQVLHRSSR